MLSQKLSRIDFKMSDLYEYEQIKLNRSKPMDTTPETKSGTAANIKTPRIARAVLQSSNRSTPGPNVSFRASTPEQS